MDTGTTTLIALRALSGNAPTSLNSLQQFMAPHLQGLIAFWFALWIMTAVVLITNLMREFVREFQKGSRDTR